MFRIIYINKISENIKKLSIKKVIIILCAICFGVKVFYPSKDETKKKQNIYVITQKAKYTNFNTNLDLIGTAISNESVDIASNAVQKIEEVYFSDCDYVKKDQLLVQLNIDGLLAEKKQAEINLSEQNREMARLSSLKFKNIVPARDFDIQKTKVSDAEAKIEAINAKLKDSKIVAPFDGILGIRKVSPGTLLTIGSIVTTIDNIEKIKVDFSIPEKYASLISPKSDVIITSISTKDKIFRGKISAVVPRISQVTRAIDVRAIIDNKDFLLKPGMMLKIQVPLMSKKAILLDEKAVLTLGDLKYIFLYKNGKAEKRYVEIGDRKNGFVEITKGIQENENIIIDGVMSLKDGTNVKLVQGKK